MVLIRIMIFLTSTTPAAATASAFPSSAEEGSCDSRVAQQPLAPWATIFSPLRGSIRQQVNSFTPAKAGAYVWLLAGRQKRLPVSRQMLVQSIDQHGVQRVI